MKTQRRPFVVEVKRGTSRSAFTVKDAAPVIFRKAAAVLFRQAQAYPAEKQLDQVSRRILPSIIDEPPAPETLEITSYNPPKRLGRPVGSKNKPKPLVRADKPLQTLPQPLESFLDDLGILSQPKRRGRPLGSRNKPRTDHVRDAVPEKVRVAIREAGVELEDKEIGLYDAPSTVDTERSNESGQVRPESEHTPKRTRLRERSKILSRYVWETTPRLGERGFKRSQ